MSIDMLAFVLALQAADPPQLDTAHIAISLSGSSARVTTQYRFRPPSDVAEFLVLRVPGQQVRFLRAGARTSVDQLPGSYRMRVTPAGSGADWVVVEYELTGCLARIPIPVPVAPADPRESVIRIRVSGLSPRVAFAHAFPRLVNDERSGDAWAEPSSVPSFVRLPPATATWSVNRLAEALVVALVVLASAIWVARRKPGRSAPRL